MASGKPGERTGRPPTIADVASRAEVSETTVSQALNGTGRVAADTRDRVLAVARELSYRPNQAARTLRTRRSGTLAFLIPAFEPQPSRRRRLLSVDVYMAQANAAAQAAFTHEHALLLLPPAATASDIQTRAIDGGIVCDPIRNGPLVSLFEDLGLPIVTIERDLGRPDRQWHVAADNRASTRQLLGHLAAAGAQRIAFLTVELPIAWAVECRQAFEAWCSERDREPLVVATNPHQAGEDAYARACELLDGPNPPDAIMATDERYPSGVIRAARDREINIPDDLMVATGIDSHEARAATPAVTAIDIRPGLQGEVAAEMLIGRITGSPTVAPRTTPTRLHVRASTTRRTTSASGSETNE